MTHQHVSCSCLKGETVPTATLLPRECNNLFIHYIPWTLRRQKNPFGYRIRQYYEYMHDYKIGTIVAYAHHGKSCVP
jgi:hypothetical protein